MYPPSIQKLIEEFAKFPTVGRRTAARFVFYLIKTPEEKVENIVEAVKNLKSSIKLCPFCFNPFQGEESFCEICRDSRRDKTLLCVVANETDQMALEKTRKYKGIYFILGGTISALKKEPSDGLRIQELEEMIKNRPEINEIILALNPTTEGETTALYLERLIDSLNKKALLDSPASPKTARLDSPSLARRANQGGPSSARRVTRLGRGLPIGGELEYADEETLSSAIESRR